MKKLTKKQKSIKGLAIWWLIFIGIILLLIWIFSNKSLYTPNKDHIKSNVDGIISQVEIGTPVQKSFVDKGCAESDIGWLGSSYQCSFEANIYFKGDGSVSTDFDRINQALRHKGFQIKTDADISLEKSATVRYEPHENTTVYFKVFRPDGRETAREYLRIDTDIPVESNEYIYGISVQAAYWSCSSGAMWEAKCPDPPSSTTPSRF